MRILILGGTSEARALSQRLAGDAVYDATLSLAGRTINPWLPPVPFRIGGFGGVDGLRDYLSAESIEAVIDATHPFAVQMSDHARRACSDVKIPLAVLTRPPGRRRTATAGSLLILSNRPPPHSARRRVACC